MFDIILVGFLIFVLIHELGSLAIDLFKIE